jgi:hypothetical protein
MLLLARDVGVHTRSAIILDRSTLQLRRALLAVRSTTDPFPESAHFRFGLARSLQ